MGIPTKKKLIEESGVPQDLAEAFIRIMKAPARDTQDLLDEMYRGMTPDATLTKAVEVQRSWSRLAIKANPEWHKLTVLNILGGFHGVEYLGHTATGLHVEYLNSGDCYVPTVLKVGDKFIWTTVGDYLETHPRFTQGGS